MSDVPDKPYAVRRAEPAAGTGTGPYVVDARLRRYLDATAAGGPAILGYGERRVTRAMAPYLGAPAFHSSLGVHPLAVRTAERLTALLHGSDARCVLTPMPPDAARVDNLVRHLRALNGCEHHGTVLRLSNPPDPGPVDTDLPDAMPRLSSIEKELQWLEESVRHCKDLVALVVEPVASDLSFWSLEVLRAARRLCTVTGALFVMDEARVAPGRAGDLSPGRVMRIRPDIMIVGTGAAAAYAPVGAVLVDSSLCDLADLHTWVISADSEPVHPFACAAVLAVLDIVEAESLSAKALEDGALLRAGLRGLADSPAIGGERGLASFTALDLVNPATGNEALPRFTAAVLDSARIRGVLVRASQGSSLLFTPPLTCRPDELDHMVETTAEAIEAAIHIGSHV